MMPTLERSAPRLTSALLPSFTEFADAVSKSFVPVDVTTSSALGFSGSVTTAEVGAVQFSEIIAGRHEVHRSDAQIAAASDSYYKVNVQLAGTGLFIQDGRETVLHPGELALYDTSRTFSLVFDTDFRALVIMVPRNLIDLDPTSVAEVTAVRFSEGDPLGGIVIPMLTTISSDLGQLSGPTGSRLSRSALGLVTTLLAQELDHVSPPNAQARLLERIYRYIDANLAMPGLSASSIARAHFVSTRHVHLLFQRRGITVSHWIRTRRLEHCSRDLCDPLLADRSVSSIGARWGFADPAHFSRAFKIEHGMSPREFRAGYR